MVPVQTPHPRSRCLLPSACGGSFPWQVLMSPPSTRAQSPLMVLGAAFRGQHGCLEAEMGHSETGTWGAPAVPQTLPCWDTASKATDVEEARSHSATAQAAFGDLTSPKAPALRGCNPTCQPQHPNLHRNCRNAGAEAPQSPGYLLLRTPGQVSFPLVSLPAPWGAPKPLRSPRPGLPPACFLPRGKAGLQAAGAGTDRRRSETLGSAPRCALSPALGSAGPPAPQFYSPAPRLYAPAPRLYSLALSPCTPT